MKSRFENMGAYGKAWTTAGIILAVGLVIGFILRPHLREVEGAPTTFYECARMHLVQEGFPRRCRADSGEVFTEYIGSSQPLFADQIQLMQLSAGTVITTSPYTVMGQATADWFGTSGFTAELHAEGRMIDRITVKPGPAGQPATPGFLPFEATFEFGAQKQGAQGAMVFKKSGSNTASTTLVIPVVF